MTKKKKHYVTLSTYIFGASRDITIQTDYTIEEIKSDWGLRERLVNEALINESNVQDEEITEWWN